ncbi:MAG TPA: glycine--tRNA ligase subunit beta [Magnetospirillaceae bacterium]|jgi:glycyl-tRNA synthetase beta chain
MPELLLEIFSEEIPARMQVRAAEDLKRLVTDGLKAAGLAWTRADAYVTPRRLTLVIDGLPDHTPPLEEERKGPRADAPAKALAGFFRNFGVDAAKLEETFNKHVAPSGARGEVAEELVAKALREVGVKNVARQVPMAPGRRLDIAFERNGRWFGVEVKSRPTDKGSVIFAYICAEAQATSALLPDIVRDVLVKFPWPKSMRWGSSRFGWVRPIHNVLCIFGGEAIGLTVDSGSLLDSPDILAETNVSSIGRAPHRIKANNITYGHRFLAPAAIAVANFAEYQTKLRAAKVILDQAERRAIIDKATQEAAAKLGLSLRPDIGLLDEVTGLVEWPVVLTGAIDEQFMGVPQEVLITAMRTHQKYFALLDKAGKLSSKFLVISNMETPDNGKTIASGNERVLRPRLSDARFFWEQDKKTPLASRVAKLGERTFFEGLGTVADKVERVRELAKLFALHTKCDAALADRAALLCKADLVTEMVGEFPELQGVMGRYYALHDGEKPEVAQAIAEHYKPQGPDDSVPSAPISIAVALADKFDTLAGFFAIGEKPTGSKDPFALRRAGIGIIRLILDNKVRVMLWTMIQRAVVAYSKDAPNAGKEILDFIIDRLKVYLRDQGARHDLIAAATGRAEDDLVRLVARIEALADFLKSDDGANLLIAYRRAANILRIEEGKDSAKYGGDTDAGLFAAPEEKTLADAIAATEAQSSAARSSEDFAGAMAALAKLRAPIDAFFDKVTVNAEDAALRVNRLRLLSGIVKAMDRVADFAKVEG